MTPSFDTIESDIYRILCEPVGKEQQAAMLLTLVEKLLAKEVKPKKPAKKRESFDGKQAKRVRGAMTPGVWYKLSDICANAGYLPESIPAISARLREMPDIDSREIAPRHWLYQRKVPHQQVVVAM